MCVFQYNKTIYACRAIAFNFHFTTDKSATEAEAVQKTPETVVFATFTHPSENPPRVHMLKEMVRLLPFLCYAIIDAVFLTYSFFRLIQVKSYAKLVYPIYTRTLCK